jgi:hypothetical protein
VPLTASCAMLIPVLAGPLPTVTLFCQTGERTTIQVEVRESSKPSNFTPDVVLHKEELELLPGSLQEISISPHVSVSSDRYVSYCLLANPLVTVATSAQRVTGVLSLSHSQNAAVAKSATQHAPDGSGIDTFEFWLPARRPGGKNLALRIDPPLHPFRAANVGNGEARPTVRPNAWVAADQDASPSLLLRWDGPKRIRKIEITFDTDYDHPLESVLMGHPEREIPFCIKRYRISGDSGELITAENHSTAVSHTLNTPVLTTTLKLDVLETRGMPAAIFELRCYES